MVQRIGIEKEVLTELERQKIDEDKKQVFVSYSCINLRLCFLVY